MEFRLSRHAEEEMTRRRIPRALVDSVLERPHRTTKIGKYWRPE
jgi:hypothetical protein